MTFTAAGTLTEAENAVAATSTTFSLTTNTVGNFILAQFACNTSFASAVTSTRCTWTQLAPATGAASFTFSSPFNSNIWIGRVNSVGSDTVSVTFNASMGGANCRFDAREFHSSTGVAVLETYGTVNTAGGTSSWATLTPAGSGRLYWGWCEDSGSAVAGSTSGFVYEPDSHSNGAGYCLSVSSAYTPVWGDSSQVAGIMVLVSGTLPGIDQPSIQPGPTWIRLFKPGLVKPVPSMPWQRATGESGTLSIVIPSLTVSITASYENSSSIPAIAPGPTWLDHYKPGSTHPVPITVSSSTTVEFGTLNIVLPAVTFNPSGTDVNPIDVSMINPGPTWLDLFKPGIQRPRPVTPWQQVTIEFGTLNIVLPVTSLILTGTDVNPVDVSGINPGPTWLDLFKPGLSRARPVVPWQQITVEFGSLNIVIPPVLSTSITSVQTNPNDVSIINPGPTWLNLFKPGLPKPKPLTLSNVGGLIVESGTLNIILPVLSLALAGTDVNPIDTPGINPGPTWIELFKPGFSKPRPVTPWQQITVESGSFNIVLPAISLALTGSDVTPIDVPSINPGPTWLTLFKPGFSKPRPLTLSINALAIPTESGILNIVLPAVSLVLSGSDITPIDTPSIKPGPTWLSLFKPGLSKSRPITLTSSGIAVFTESGTLNIVLSVPVFTPTGIDVTPTDMPEINPGPTWLALFKPGLVRPHVLTVSSRVTVEFGTFNAGLSSPIVTLAAIQTNPNDVPVFNPGPTWWALFKPGISRPHPEGLSVAVTVGSRVSTGLLMASII